MAEDLVIGGYSMVVLEDTWEEQQATVQGARMTMALGNIVSTEDPASEARVATVQVYFHTLELEEGFRSAIPRGQPVTVSGGLPERSFLAFVDITQVTRQSRIILNSGGIVAPGRTLVRVATLRIEESRVV